METLNRQRFKALTEKGITLHFLYLHEGTGLQNKLNTNIFVTNEDAKIKEIIEREQYNAIIVCSDHVLLQRIKSFGYEGIVVYEVQGLGNSKRQVRKFLQFIARERINQFSDAILYPKTEHLSELIEELYPHKQKFSFHNCLDTDHFRYRRNATYQKPIVGWIGRIEKNKNWQGCFAIIKQLLHSFPNLKLWMFVDDTLTRPSEKRRFENLLTKMQLTNVVKPHNNVPHDQMPHYLSQIANSGGFLLSTSRLEGFGYAVLEALSCQCPVLTTDSDGVRSIVIHNQTGKLFAYGNTRQAVKEATALMTDLNLRKNIVERGEKYVKQHFSLDQYATHFIAMLQTLQNV